MTGATGFVGTGLLERLRRLPETVHIRAVARRPPDLAADRVEWTGYAGLDDAAGLALAVQGVDVVIHAAARAHVMHETAGDPLAEFRKVNRDGTVAVADQAARLGVRRFVFLSSVKVNGEATLPGRPYRPDDVPAPVDPYGVAKAEAEGGLRELGAACGMEVVIVRPPLIYGPGVKGNFRTMMATLCRGVPLPLGAIHNRRSLVALSNLADLIVTCLDHPAAANQTFLASDGEDLSTTELLRRTARALGHKARLLPVPAALLEIGAAALGKRHLSQRLCGSLQVDIGKNRRLLGWSPPTPVDAALSEAARDFLDAGRQPA